MNFGKKIPRKHLCEGLCCSVHGKAGTNYKLIIIQMSHPFLSYFHQQLPSILNLQDNASISHRPYICCHRWCLKNTFVTYHIYTKLHISTFNPSQAIVFRPRAQHGFRASAIFIYISKKYLNKIFVFFGYYIQLMSYDFCSKKHEVPTQEVNIK